MSTDTDLTTCPHCGSAELFTVQCDGGPHYARTGCSTCGWFIRWEPAPMTPARAAAFVMPFGRYRGTQLADVPTDYLRWVVTEEVGGNSLQRAGRYHLEHGGESRPCAS